ncbi:MAG: hypothetical protein WBW06_05305, partial [Xanthobacteraceae bacterium]
MARFWAIMLVFAMADIPCSSLKPDRWETAIMSRTAHLRLPFFDAQHRAFADELDEWARATVAEVEGGPHPNPPPLAGEGREGDVD